MKQFIYAALLMTTLTCCAQNEEKNMTNENIAIFIENYSSFSMNIEAAGLASIESASYSETGSLQIDYAYNSGGEARTGSMTLLETEPNRFEGDWKTIADNGHVYQGSLYFTFTASGEAEGYYDYFGVNYKIDIHTKK